MKKYVNQNNRLVCVKFEDGTAQFLRRGESISTAKKVKQLPEGVTVHDVVKNTSKVKNKTEK